MPKISELNYRIQFIVKKSAKTVVLNYSEKKFSAKLNYQKNALQKTIVQKWVVSAILSAVFYVKVQKWVEMLVQNKNF